MKNSLLVAVLLCCAVASAAPKTTRLCIGDTHGKGVLVIENISSAALPAVQKAVAQSKHRADLPALRDELQTKLGPAYRVTVLGAEEFNSSLVHTPAPR